MEYIKKALMFLWALILLLLGPIFFYNYDSLIKWLDDIAETIPLREMPEDLRRF